MRLKQAVPVVLASALLAGCSAERVEGNSAPPSPAPIVQFTPASPLPGSASLVDPSGDGGVIDILGLDLVLDTESLTLTYDLAALPPAIGTAEVSLFVGSQYSSLYRILGVVYTDGEPTASIYDSQLGQKQKLDAEPQSQGSSITMVFPASSVAGLGNSFKFSVLTTLDRKTLDECPDRLVETFRPDLPT
jgi:hypothetical protein